jgi:hypothetical protein
MIGGHVDGEVLIDMEDLAIDLDACLDEGVLEEGIV